MHRQRTTARTVLAALVIAGAGLIAAVPAQAQQPAQGQAAQAARPPLGFFITSKGLGDGANLGGLHRLSGP